MPRSQGTVVENNFVKGLISEGTGLNFPENGCTDTENCVFEQTGQVRRRLGIDIEGSAITNAYSFNDGVVVEYLWRAAALTGTFVFLVLQVGSSVLIYNLSGNGALSTGFLYNFSLIAYRTNPYADLPFECCQFAAGAGRLFITHPACDPLVLEFDDTTSTFSVTPVTIQIRDFEGVDDGLEVDTQPSVLTNEHWYNLMNQGWYQNVRTGTVS